MEKENRGGEGIKVEQKIYVCLHCAMFVQLFNLTAIQKVSKASKYLTRVADKTLGRTRFLFQ